MVLPPACSAWRRAELRWREMQRQHLLRRPGWHGGAPWLGKRAPARAINGAAAAPIAIHGAKRVHGLPLSHAGQLRGVGDARSPVNSEQFRPSPRRGYLGTVSFFASSDFGTARLDPWEAIAQPNFCFKTTCGRSFIMLALVSEMQHLRLNVPIIMKRTTDGRGNSSGQVTFHTFRNVESAGTLVHPSLINPPASSTLERTEIYVFRIAEVIGRRGTKNDTATNTKAARDTY